MSDAQRTQPARVMRLKNKLVEQGVLVRSVVDAAVLAVFENDPDKAAFVHDNEDRIDTTDVEIEREAVDLLQDAIAGSEPALGTFELRMILTIVKVNNEYERMADLALRAVSRMDQLRNLPERPPRTFRVMANSVIGIVQTTCQAFEQMDAELAGLVLSSDDTTEAFRDEIVRDLERSLTRGEHTPDFAFALNRVSAALARITDHCTNVAEQVIYVATGKIVRHSDDHWTEPRDPQG